MGRNTYGQCGTFKEYEEGRMIDFLDVKPKQIDKVDDFVYHIMIIRMQSLMNCIWFWEKINMDN